MYLPREHFIPNEYQAQLFSKIVKFDYDNPLPNGTIPHIGTKENVLCWRRQLGKTESAIQLAGLFAAHSPSRPMLFVFNTFKQAKQVLIKDRRFQKAFLDNGIELVEPGPGKFITKINESDLYVEFYNKSFVQAVGIDRNADKIRGLSNVVFAIIDEYAHAENEEVFEMVIEPMLRRSRGAYIIVSTPNGRNDFFHKYEYCRDESLIRPKEAFASRVTAHNTLSEELGLTKQDLIRTYNKIARRIGKRRARFVIQQEYFCSWDASSASAIWGEEMAEIVKQHEDPSNNRIQDFFSQGYPYPNIPIHTAFDLGYGQGGDEQVCIAFQIIPDHDNHCNTVVILDWYSDTHSSIRDVIKEFIKPNNYDTGYCIVPHDIRGALYVVDDPVRWMRDDYNMDLRILPQPTSAGKDHGIQMARDLLRHCWFDKRCQKNKSGETWNLIRALQDYRGEWDPKRQIEKPYHDRASHYADAFRYLTVGMLEEYELPKRHRSINPIKTKGVPWQRNDGQLVHYDVHALEEEQEDNYESIELSQ